jgi:hypothetical protein
MRISAQTSDRLAARAVLAESFQSLIGETAREKVLASRVIHVFLPTVCEIPSAGDSWVSSGIRTAEVQTLVRRHGAQVQKER